MCAPLAAADGDPASDVLAVQSVFVPPDAGISPAQQTQVDGLVDAAARRGVEIRVAVIAHPDDLGSITPLWRQPRRYALFLGDELSYSFHGELLVVMPNGFGTDPAGDAARASLTSLGAPGRALGGATTHAIEHMAHASGLALTPMTAVQTVAPSSPFEPLPWIAFGCGWLAIAAAWAASLRLQPVRRAR